MLFCRNLHKKRNDKFGYLNPISGKLWGDAQPWLMARWKANGRLSIRLNWIFLAISYGSGAMRRNMYSSAVFAGVLTSLHSNFTGQGRPPSTILGVKTPETLDYRRWRPHSSAFLRFDTIPECDGRTDRRTDEFAVAYTALLALQAL